LDKDKRKIRFARKNSQVENRLKIETKRYLAAFAQAAREVVPLPRRPYHLIGWLPLKGYKIRTAICLWVTGDRGKIGTENMGFG
jgi:hypothetical protein